MRWLEYGAVCLLPCILLLTVGKMARGRGAGLDSFTSGATDGLKCAVELLPTLVLLLTAVRMLGASGAVERLSALLSPVFERLGVPVQLLPLLFTRPVSGSASTAVFVQLIEACGVDSFPVLCASVIMGSSDTVLYVMGIYLGAAGIKRGRYALPVAFAGMLFNIFFACLLCRLFFGG